jgi:hypothetical protein
MKFYLNLWLIAPLKGHSLHENPLVRRLRPVDFEVGPVKIENQEVRLAFGIFILHIYIKIMLVDNEIVIRYIKFYFAQYLHLRGLVQIIGGQ